MLIAVLATVAAGCTGFTSATPVTERCTPQGTVNVNFGMFHSIYYGGDGAAVYVESSVLALAPSAEDASGPLADSALGADAEGSALRLGSHWHITRPVGPSLIQAPELIKATGQRPTSPVVAEESARAAGAEAAPSALADTRIVRHSAGVFGASSNRGTGPIVPSSRFAPSRSAESSNPCVARVPTGLRV